VSGATATESWSASLARATAALAAAGCEAPRLDAELLLAAALGVERTALYITPGAELEPTARSRYQELLARRLRREPVAYILGSKGFRRLMLHVDPRVLIPRPETELLVEVGLELAASVADVGTGSGAVALALKDERPDLRVTGIDSSADALAVARSNARRLGLDVRFVHADLLDDFRYDAVLANLPYVAAGDELPPEIERYEPDQALRAGPDGLDVVRRLIDASAGPALLALEVGAGQADVVSELLTRAGFTRVARRRDLAGHERVVVGKR
jgi:release factor glutamine methyltransferase